MSRWVQHISGQGEKWEEFAPGTDVHCWCVKKCVATYYLPKSEYRDCADSAYLEGAMSIRTIYTCDKCGKEQDTNNQFWTVGVVATCGYRPSRTEPYVKEKMIQVCRPCLESLGIHVQIKDQEVPPPAPTVEDLIREIIQRCTE